MVFVSHALPQVRQLCDRLIWLDEGKVAAEGDPREVIKAYKQSMQMADS